MRAASRALSVLSDSCTKVPSVIVPSCRRQSTSAAPPAELFPELNGSGTCLGVLPHFPVINRHFEVSKAWTSRKLQVDDITQLLSPAAAKEFDNYVMTNYTNKEALNRLLANEADPSAVPLTFRELAALRKEVIDRYGFMVLKAPESAAFQASPEVALAYSRFASILVSSLLGVLLPQDKSGKKFIEVFNRNVGTMQQGARYHQTRQGGSLHTDNVASVVPWDLLVLTCVAPAAVGGENILVSAPTVHNYLQRLAPRALDTLTKLFVWETRGFQDDAFFLAPVIYYRPGPSGEMEPAVRYLRDYMESAAKRFTTGGLTDQQLWAFDALDAAIEMSENQFRFGLDTFDHLIASGTQLLHGRTGFVDSWEASVPQPQTTASAAGSGAIKQRVLLRSWVGDADNVRRNVVTPLSKAKAATQRRGFATRAGSHAMAARLEEDESRISTAVRPEDYHVVVLAAGVSRRMGDFANNKPKSLLQLHGQPIIERQLATLEKKGFNLATMMLGGGAEHLRSFIEARQSRGLAVTHALARDFETTGHAWTFHQVRPSWEAAGRRPILLVHADIVYHPGILDAVLAGPPNNLGLIFPYERRTGDEWLALGDGERVTGLSPLKTLEEEAGKKGARGAQEHQRVGEVVGMNKFSSTFSRAFFDFMERRFGAGGVKANWEPVLDAFLQTREARENPDLRLGYVQTALPWVNLNYRECYERARKIFGKS